MNALDEPNVSELWSLAPADHARIAVEGRANRLSFAVLLVFSREPGRFPLDRSDNRRHRPVIHEEDVPIDGVVRGLWLQAVVEKDAEGWSRVNRISDEIFVLKALLDKLRCKDGALQVLNSSI